MTPINTPAGYARVEDASMNGMMEITTTLQRYAEFWDVDTETSSLVHVEPSPENEPIPVRQTSRDNADLYGKDLPEYSPLVTNGERSLEAQETQNEKEGTQTRIPEYGDHPPCQSLSPAYEEYQTQPLPSPTHNARFYQRWQQQHSNLQDGHNSDLEHNHTPGRHTSTEENAPLIVSPTASNPDQYHVTESLTTANRAGVRTCSILHDHAAAWIIRKRDLPLSTLAAAVLTKEGLLQPKELKL